MNRLFSTILLLLTATILFGQTFQTIELNKEYSNVNLDKSQCLNYTLKLKKDELYEVSVLQQGIDIKLTLTDENDKKILDKDSPNGQNGYEKFEYLPIETKLFHLKIERLKENGNSEKGQVSILVRKISKSEVQLREKIKKELEPENKKNILTLDIDHFWEAFDNLKKCKNKNDSINVFQKLYIDRATDGLKDFIKVRNFTAEEYVEKVNKFPKFYNSVRKYTFEAKKSEIFINEVFEKLKAIYPNFKPFKVCFAIGTIRTGGTVSDNFVLIGTEMTTIGDDVDFSEFNNDARSKQIRGTTDISLRIKNIIAHECVHTQQKQSLDSNGIKCQQLYYCLHEGICDFIGELVTGSHININIKEYGDLHEKELWQEFKNSLCKNNGADWLYNGGAVKDKPADLGYYIGYKIAEEYYKNTIDKRQAIIDIIEMNDPIKFLQLSKYDQKEKK